MGSIASWGCLFFMGAQPIYKVSFQSNQDKVMQQNSNTSCYECAELCQQALLQKSAIRKYLLRAQ